MHHRKVYKHVHKLHHEITAPIAAGTSYCSPFEHLVNLTTVAIVIPPIRNKRLTFAIE